MLAWWPQVGRRTIKADLWAGLTGAVIVLPQGVAFAAIAGLPPEYGLYAAMVPVIIAALFGSSHHLVSGPTTAISLVIFANVHHFAEPGSAEFIRQVLTLTFLAGLFQLGLGVARLGALVNFVSHSVVTGFTAGAAILIATSQLGGFFGLSLPRGGSFVHTWGHLFQHLPQANPYVVGVGAATFISALVIRHFWPRLPAMLLAMLVGAGLNHAIAGAAHGVLLMGALPDSLPPFSLPVPGLDEVRHLVPGALAIAMLGLAEAVSIARAVAVRSQQQLDSSQEFVGQGLANVVGSFFSAYASSGSFTRTGLNFESGAKTPLAAVFSALMLAAIVLLVAPLTAYLPLAAMSGVILLVAANLADIAGIRHILRTDKSEAGVLVVTFMATLFVQLEFAIFSGVILSLLMYLRRTSHPNFVVLAPDPDNLRRPLVNVRRKAVPECPQLKILRLDGSIFFGAVAHISEDLHRIMEDFPEQCHILIVGGGINFIDASGCHMLFNEALNLKLSGRDMFFCGLKTEVREVLDRGMCVRRLGGEHIFESESQAIAHMVPRLDPERCACCHTRVFRECERMPGGEHHLPVAPRA
ncbi:MAG: sodium-independent anion transporter [Desulfovibrionaceae bacterium CG1_02_65_16]|nr:MAG: sodium-independent anion transporter [Desulfovibrionaceae bacterium CG1_02_65_16]